MSTDHAINIEPLSASANETAGTEQGREFDPVAVRPFWQRVLVRQRGWLYPLVPLLAFALGVGGLTLGLRLVCEIPVVASIYNTRVLWAVALFHEFEHIAVWGLLAAVLLLAGFVRYRVTKFGRQRTRKLTALYALVLVGVGAYLVTPWGLARLAWWWSIPTVALLTWLWVRAAWAYWGILIPLSKWAVRGYWRATLDGRAYLDLLARLRAAQSHRGLAPRQRPERDSEFHSDAERRRCERVERSFARWERVVSATEKMPGVNWLLAHVVARLTPRVAESLASEDVILVRELEYLADAAWADTEEALYVYGAALDGEAEAITVARVRRFFRKWRLLADALLDCIVFEFFPGKGSSPLIEPPSDEDVTDRTWQSIVEGTARLSRFSRRLFLPTLSGCAEKTAGNPLGMFWWHEGDIEGSFRSAAEFVECEIEAVLWLGWNGVFQKRRLDDRNATDSELMQLLALSEFDDGQADWKRLLALRLTLAIIVRRSLRELDFSNQADEQWRLVSEALWEPIRKSMAGVVHRVLSEPQGDPLMTAFAIETRYRFFDACLLSLRSQPVLLRDEVKNCEELFARHSDSYRRDQWFLGYSYLSEAWNTELSPELRDDAYRIAANAFSESGHCSLATYLQVVEPAFRRAAEFPNIKPVERPQETRYSKAEVHGSWSQWNAVGRQPGVFFRKQLKWIWIVPMLLCCAGLYWQAEGDLLAAPDLRLGGAHLHEPVNFLASGIEEKNPSLWAATEGGGVHVKGGGKNHHWTQITAANSREGDQPGLLADDVRCVQTDASNRLISYMAQRKQRAVVNVSDYPRAAPGTWPVTAPTVWSVFLGDSSFAGVNDDELTLLKQSSGCPLMLVGTREHGLGRYHVAERRWLQIIERDGERERDVTINTANGFLLAGQNEIRDVASLPVGKHWVAWVATPDGIAGGPIWPVGDEGLVWQPEQHLTPEKWQQIAGSKLLAGDVEQVRLWVAPAPSREDGVQTASLDKPSGAETLHVDYRTKDGGLGTWFPDLGLRGSEHWVRIGQRPVPRLDADRLRSAAYTPAQRRLWMIDRPGFEIGGDRVLAYREANHEWSYESGDTIRTGRAVLDIAPDTVLANQLLVGTEMGVETVTDHGGALLDRESHGPQQSVVLQVASTPESVLARAVLPALPNDQPRVGVYELNREADGTLPSGAQAKWKTVIGTRRFPKSSLALTDVTIAEPATQKTHAAGGEVTAHGSNVWFGTKDSGIGYIDRRTHEVYQPPEIQRLDPRVLDLCVIPNQQRERDDWLLQVNSHHTVNGVRFTQSIGQADAKPLPAVAMLNRTAATMKGELDPNALGAVRAWSTLPGVDAEMNDAEAAQYLFVGGRQGTVARYDMRLHDWAEVGLRDAMAELSGLPGILTGFHVSRDRFWAHTWSPNKQGSLFVLGEDKQSWDPIRLSGIKPYAFDAGAKRMLAVTGDNAIVDVHPDGNNVLLLSPRSTGTQRVPRLAAVVQGGKNDSLYVGFEKQAARFDLGTWRWSDDFTIPGGRPLQELLANSSGVWLLDTDDLVNGKGPSSGKLFRRDADGAENTPEIMSNVLRDRIAVSDRELVFLTTNGTVYRWEPPARSDPKSDGRKTMLVGRDLDLDVHGKTRAVVRFPGQDLCVAVGSRLGRYNVVNHDWQDVTPPTANGGSSAANGAAIEQLVVTSGALYARLADGRLFRSRNPESSLSWEPVNNLLANIRPNNGIRFVAASESAPVTWIGRVGDDLGIVADSIGSFRLKDQSEEPQWLTARSIGPDADVGITCATDLGEDLYLGTAAGGLWCYVPVNGPGTPHAWQSIQLPSTAQGDAVRSIVTIPGDTNHLAVMTDSNAWLLGRKNSGVWSEPLRRLGHDGSRPVALAADNGSLYWSETPNGAANDRAVVSTLLYRLDAPFADVSTSQLVVGAGMPANSKTSSVAVDTDTSLVLRADSDGNVSSYDWSKHAWMLESLSGKTKEPLRLFFAAGSHWAFAPKNGVLYQRVPGTKNATVDWTPFEISRNETIAEVSDRLDGLLLRSTAGRVWHLRRDAEASLHVIELLPPQRSDVAADWKKGALAESSDWLLASDDRNLRAYHRGRHEWSSLLDSGVDRFFKATPRVTTPAFYARDRQQQRLWFVSPAAADSRQVEVKEVELKTAATAKNDARFPLPVVAVLGEGTEKATSVVLATDRSVRQLVDEKYVRKLVGPVPLNLAGETPPEVTAVGEYEGLLLLGLTHQGGSSIALYDPQTLNWQHVTDEVSGPVERFWSLREGLLVQMKGAADGLSKLQVLARLSGAQSGWTLQDKIHVRDVAQAPDQSLWSIDSTHRIARVLFQTEDGRLVVNSKAAAELGVDRLPKAIRVALTVETAVLALLEDGSLWSYSLSDLAWRRELQGERFVDLLNSNGNLVAVEVGENGQGLTYHRYRKAAGSWSWNVVTREGTGELKLPATERDLSADDWKITRQDAGFQFAWTDKPGKDPSFVPVEVSTGGEHGRFAFNKFGRFEWKNGSLWCETLARTQDNRAIIREFKPHEPNKQLAESVTGLARFGRDFVKLEAELAPTSPVTLTGSTFRSEATEDGLWQTAINKQRIAITLHQSGTVVPLRLRSFEKNLWQMDVDRWNSMAAEERWLHVSTEGGIVSLLDSDLRDGNVVRRGYQAAVRPLLLIPNSGTQSPMFAQEESGGLLKADSGKTTTTWAAFKDDGGAVGRAFAHDNAVQRSNANLSAWRVADDGQLRMKVGGALVDVTLTRDGFEFDRVLAMELEDKHIAFYGSDGRVRYQRDKLGQPPSELDKDWSTRSVNVAQDALRVRRDEQARLLLTGRVDPQTSASSIWRYTAGAWQKLESAEAREVQSWLGRTLLDGHNNQGWTWNSDESVVMPQDARVGRQRGFSAWFDLKSGQFAFDTCLDLKLGPKGLWAATRAGVTTWNEGKLVDLDPAAAAPRGASAAALFLRSEGSTSKLEMQPAADGMVRVFQFEGGWKPAADVAKSQAARQWNDSHLLSGLRWTTTVNAAPLAAGQRLQNLEFHWSPQSGRNYRRWLVPASGWRMDAVRQMCLVGERVVFATDRGLFDSVGKVVGEDAVARQVAAEKDAAGKPRVHVELLRIAGGSSKPVELWLQPDLTSSSGPNGATFAELANTLLKTDTGLRWDWKKTAEGRIEIHVGSAAEGAPGLTKFENGRFDFDRVGDLLLENDDALLATAAGFVQRPKAVSADAVFKMAGTPLPQEVDVSGAKLFTVSAGAGRTRVIALGENVYQSTSAGNWKKATEPAAGQLLAQFETEVAVNQRWAVTRPQPVLQARTAVAALRPLPGTVTTGSGPQDVQFELQVGTSQPQLVEFSSGDGTFSFCVTTALKQTKDGKQLMAGSPGGVVQFEWSKEESNLLLKSLTTNFVERRAGEAPQRPVWFPRLWRVEDGTLIALIRNGKANEFRRFDAAKGVWLPITSDEARRLIKDLDWINRAAADAKTRRDRGWNVVRVDDEPVSDDELAVSDSRRLIDETYRQRFEFEFDGEPVRLVQSDSETVFEHDVAVSLDWVDGSLFVASPAGVSRLRMDSDSGQLVADLSQRHLWTNRFGSEQPLVPFFLRASGDSTTGDGTTTTDELVCWLRPSGAKAATELRQMKFDSVANDWLPDEARADYPVLVPMDDLWQWSLLKPSSGKGVVGITPAMTPSGASSIRFPASIAAADYQWFRNGQVAFWSLPQVPLESERDWASARDRLAFANSLFVATDGGILQLARTAGQWRTAIVHAADQAERPLTEVTDLSRDDVTGTVTARSHGQSGPQFYRLVPHSNDPFDDDWTTSLSYEGRLRTVHTEWLTINHRQAAAPIIQFSEGISDVGNSLSNGQLFLDGRFRFDVVRDFVRRSQALEQSPAQDSSTEFWMLTPLGVVCMNASSGRVTKHFAESFRGELPVTAALHVDAGLNLEIVEPAWTVWRETARGRWLKTTDPLVAEQLRTTVKNDLMQCVEQDRHGPQREFQLTVKGVDQTFRNASQQPALLSNGVLFFDDVRDLRHSDQRLLIAARFGIWEYDLGQIRPLIEGQKNGALETARIPSRVHYRAEQQSTPLEPVAYINGPKGALFVRTDDAACLMLGDDGGWYVTTIPVTDSETVADPIGDRVWRVSWSGNELTVKSDSDRDALRRHTVTLPYGSQVHPQKALVQNDSIWLPLDSGLLWYRIPKDSARGAN